MKRLFLFISIFLCFFIKTNASNFNDLFNFNIEHNSVTFSLRYNMHERIYCDYIVNGELNSTFSVTTIPNIIDLGRNNENAEFDFYKFINTDDDDVKNDKRVSVGLATIDDIDLKITYYGFYPTFDNSCGNSSIIINVPKLEKAKVNNDYVDKICLCQLYNDAVSIVDPFYTQEEFQSDYDNLLLSSTTQLYCGNSTNGLKMMNPSTIVKTAIKEDDNLMVFNINGQLMPFHKLVELKSLSPGIYMIKMIDNGVLKNYKYVVE